MSCEDSVLLFETLITVSEGLQLVREEDDLQLINTELYANSALLFDTCPAGHY